MQNFSEGNGPREKPNLNCLRRRDRVADGPSPPSYSAMQGTVRQQEVRVSDGSDGDADIVMNSAY